jgi:hypothetical protein
MQPLIAPTTSPRMAAGQMIVRLAWVVFGAVGLTAGLMAGLILASHRPLWWIAWSAAVGVSVLAALLALVPVAAGLIFGVQYAAYGYLAGAFLRMMVSLAGGLASVLAFRTPAAPTLLLLIPLYLSQVAAECVVLSCVFWATPGGESSPT